MHVHGAHTYSTIVHISFHIAKIKEALKINLFFKLHTPSFLLQKTLPKKKIRFLPQTFILQARK